MMDTSSMSIAVLQGKCYNFQPCTEAKILGNIPESISEQR